MRQCLLSKALRCTQGSSSPQCCKSRRNCIGLMGAREANCDLSDKEDTEVFFAQAETMAIMVKLPLRASPTCQILSLCKEDVCVCLDAQVTLCLASTRESYNRSISIIGEALSGSLTLNAKVSACA